MITAENLSRSYPNKELFHNLCFTLGKGICLVEGKSGCGKTTLLRILSGLEKPVNGRVLYSKRNFSFAACGQEPSLYGEYSLKKNIRILKPDYCQKEREEVAERLGFSFFDKPLVSLSGGERQKAEIAFCLSKRADAYLLDEPFSSLDEKAKSALVDVLNEKAQHSLLIIVNHDRNIKELNVASTICFHSGNSQKTQGYFEEHRIIEVKSQCKDVDKFSLSRKQWRVFPNIVHLFHKAKGYSAFKMLLSIGCRILFFLGLANTPRSEMDYREHLYERDVFSEHGVALDSLNGNVPDLALWDSLEKEGLPYRNARLQIGENNQCPVLFIGTQEEGISFFSSETGSVFPSGEISFQDKSYPLQKKTEKEIKDCFPGGTPKIVQSILDGYQQGMLFFCSQNILDERILYPNDSICFASHPDWKIKFDIGLEYDDISKDLYLAKPNLYSVSESSGYALSIPGVSKGHKVLINGKRSLTVSEEKDDGIIHVSSLLRKAILRSDYSLYADEYPDFGYFLDDKTITKLNKQFDSILSPVDVLHESGNTDHSFWYYLSSAVFFLAYLFFVFFASKGEKNLLRSSLSVYEKNSFSKASHSFSLLFRNLIETLPSLLTGIRCYFFLFLPKVNKNIRMESFTKPEGYYYYSKEPINPYYDNILKPFQCHAFHPFFFFSFAVFFLMILAGFTALMLHRKNKKNR